MSKKLAATLSGALVVLSIVAGIVWWAIGIRRGAFQEISADGFGMFLVLLAVAQGTAWAIVSADLWVFTRSRRQVEVWPMILIAALLGLATMLWGVTPILGIPLVLAAITGGTVFVFRLVRVRRATG